ncbi:MAG: FeoA family protein [Candidatus Brocadiaceae bacterium]|jgi:ferrous iron transport protein A
MLTNLEKLPAAQEAIVVGFRGGRGMSRKVDAMGLRPGKTVRKVSSQFMAGPVIVVIDGRQVAMGRGIARRIDVETVSE